MKPEIRAETPRGEARDPAAPAQGEGNPADRPPGGARPPFERAVGRVEPGGARQLWSEHARMVGRHTRGVDTHRVSSGRTYVVRGS